MKKRKARNALAVIQSILAAAFGVQSSKNREKDFRKGRTSHFIIAGTLFTLLFVLTLLALVNLVIPE